MSRTRIVVDLSTNAQTVEPYTPQEEAAADAAKALDDAARTPQALATADQAQLNAILAAPGSVVRGLALVVLDLANGVIPIKAGPPLYTAGQLVSLIQQKMR